MSHKRSPDQWRKPQNPDNDSPAVSNPVLSAGFELVNKHKAAQALAVSPETLKKYRLQAGSTLIPGIHYHVWNSRTIRYNLDLIKDWGINRNNPAAHQKAIDAYLATLPCNQPKQRGRKAS